MSRRKPIIEEEENRERWLVSYADFITLLFAFFVVLYAYSSVNEAKMRQLSNAITTAFGTTPVSVTPETPPAVTGLPRPLGAPKKRPDQAALNKEREKLTGIARDLMEAMAPLLAEGKVKVTQGERGVTLEINAAILFRPGDARLADDSTQALRAVAQVLKDDNHQIQIQGHTDSLPISNAVFPSNWELSAFRAGSVVRLFVDSGVAEERLTAVGYGSTRPVADNSLPEGRLRNRRVAVMILSNLPEAVTEVSVSASNKP
ncbi:chemotaxis protein MotB [Noviherbaspirillum humi]|uniref:Chemotaxis protein MotB n=1 Tax=Noviherbaspirillum humi TaxID=1688639 RepID=A0A239FUF8_9BURK|nr:flagellar motor protein MotD [Noviherbaspirillum humi]SNS60786.1 chemotaxis protein MotB [Noviherbaspirillum humi]